VEKNFSKLLDIFSEQNVQVTCFFLGWVAEHFPDLVKDAAARGHEIASHGYAHCLVYEQSRGESVRFVPLHRGAT
jgi:peptidoglycan/xylan/chitin deacetylase (PgdA/CDA1 family)